MKTKFAFLFLLLATPTQAGLDRKEIAIRAIVQQMGLIASGEAFLRTICRLENGRPGKRCGHMNKYRDREVYGNPCLPDGATDYAKTARAVHRHMQAFVLLHGWRRERFFKSFSEFFHAGGGAKTEEGRKKANEVYSNQLKEIFYQERKWVRQRNIDGAYDPEQSLNREQPPPKDDP